MLADDAGSAPRRTARLPAVDSVFRPAAVPPGTDVDGVDGPVDVFEPEGTTWTAVSGRLALMRRLEAVTAAVVVGAVAALVLLLTGVPGWLPVLAVVVVLVVLALAWVLIGRNARSWGYTERADDLLVRRGIAWRQLVVVPYGRMQFVDVTRGPVHRWFGLATVQLHTASAATDARIPGLEPAEAARLRDRLAARGEAHAAGL